MNIAQFIIDIAAKGDGQTLSKIRSVQNGLDSAERSAGKLKKGLGDAFKSLPGAEFAGNFYKRGTAGCIVVRPGIDISVLHAQVVEMRTEHYVLMLQGVAFYYSDYVRIIFVTMLERNYKIPVQKGLEPALLVTGDNIVTGHFGAVGTGFAAFQRVGSKVVNVLSEPFFPCLCACVRCGHQEHAAQQQERQ